MFSRRASMRDRSMAVVSGGKPPPRSCLTMFTVLSGKWVCWRVWDEIRQGHGEVNMWLDKTRLWRGPPTSGGRFGSLRQESAA
jgi:hypothetical protein